VTDAELEADPAEAVRLVAGMVRRGEGGEAFRERRRVLSWSATEAGLLSPSFVEERGTAARIRRGRETLLVARSGTSLDSLREAVREASRRAGTSPFFKALRRPGPPPKHEPSQAEESEEARTAALASALAHAVPDPRGLSLSLVLSHVSVARAVVTPRALHSLGSSSRLEAAGTIVGGGHERPFAFQSPLPFPAAAAALSHALHEATRPVPRFPATEGEADIVFSSSAASVFWHEAVGHPLEAEGPERASVLARVRGAAVAPPGLEVVDDPRRSDLAGGFALDDEGVIARPVTLLHDGHVGDVLTDRRTAAEASNGHGRTSDYRRPPRVRMSNLVVSKGHAKLHDLFAECGTGIFVREISAGSADPESGRFVLVVEHAELLRRGRQAGALTRFALVGDLLVALSNLFPERGDEALPAVGLGLCVKGGDGVAVGGAAPAMLIRGLHVRGARL